MSTFSKKLFQVKKFQLQSMSNAITCIDKRFAVKNSGISCLALIFSLSNLRTILPMAASACKKWVKPGLDIQFKQSEDNPASACKKWVQAWVARCDNLYHDTVFLCRSIRSHGPKLGLLDVTISTMIQFFWVDQ